MQKIPKTGFEPADAHSIHLPVCIRNKSSDDPIDLERCREGHN